MVTYNVAVLTVKPVITPLGNRGNFHPIPISCIPILVTLSSCGGSLGA